MNEQSHKIAHLLESIFEQFAELQADLAESIAQRDEARAEAEARGDQYQKAHADRKILRNQLADARRATLTEAADVLRFYSYGWDDNSCKMLNMHASEMVRAMISTPYNPDLAKFSVSLSICAAKRINAEAIAERLFKKPADVPPSEAQPPKP